MKEMGSEIDVGALLFGLQYLDGTAPRSRVGKWRADTVGLEVAVVEGNWTAVGGERS